MESSLRSVVLALGLGTLAVVGAQGVYAAEDTSVQREEVVFREALVIGQVGRYGRSAVHVDAIELRRVQGRWSPPAAGDTVSLPGGETRTWESVAADEDGWFKHAALRGGYAYASIDCAEPRVMLLEAAGHSKVYVNDELRPGDTYRTGYVSLPVGLKPGRNEFLFLCGRGAFRAKLVAPKSPVSIDLRDATLPDLVVGEAVDTWGAVVLINAAAQSLRGATVVASCAGVVAETACPPVPPLSVRKVGFRIVGDARPEEATADAELGVYRDDARTAELARAAFELRVRRPDQSRKRTFVSAIDGTVQYYVVQPAALAAGSDGPPALFLSLHGAAVEATNQADAYARKDWGHVVAPTNRRPYGFDWEAWGRLDAVEVLERVQQELGTDPLRTYLVGHSMGGHGVWQVGATLPDRFAALAPSAGWISFWSYTGAQRFEDADPIERILTRATNTSDTLGLSRNYLHHGIYILHGDKDDNVPVRRSGYPSCPPRVWPDNYRPEKRYVCQR